MTRAPIPIEYGVPYPEKCSYSSKYNFAAMKVGGSFSVPIGDRYAPEVRGNLCGSAYAFRNSDPKYWNWVLSTRILTDEDGNEQLRIWRLEDRVEGDPKYRRP